MNNLENLRNLFSEDDNVVFKALLEKKDLINRKFYVVLSLANNKDIEDIFDYKVRFRKFYSNDENIVSFRVLYLFEEIPSNLENDEFIVEYDFTGLKDREYKILFANLYPCLQQNQIEEKEDNQLVFSLKQMMNITLGDYVLILDNQELEDNCLPLNVISKIICHANLIEGYQVHLRLLAEKLKIKFGE